MVRRITATALLAGLVFAGTAAAGTVSVHSNGCRAPVPICSFTDFTADPREANDVSIRRVPAGVEIHDAGAPVRVTGSCRTVDANTATCPGIDGVDVNTGDGDDRVTVAPDELVPGVTADLGSGSDRSEGASHAIGGPGDDVLIAEAPGLPAGASRPGILIGGPGSDTLIGGTLDDWLAPGDVADDGTDTPAPDVVDGGGGSNTVSYTGEPLPVSVDLAGGTATENGVTTDQLSQVENVTGGSGDDTLTGDGAANEISGGPGDDHLSGEGGDDRLGGGAGFDHFAGGPGDDTIDAHYVNMGEGLDAAPEPIDCGAGSDDVTEILDDVVAPNCERVLGQPYRPVPVRRHGGILLRFTVGCPAGYSFSNSQRMPMRCRGTITAIADELDGERPARTAFVIRPHRRHAVVVPYEGLPLQMPLAGDRYIDVALTYRSGGSLPPRVTRYEILLPKGCAQLFACGATTATP